jgi:hypothetical protein
MSHDPSIKTKIRACLREAFREQVEFHTMMADLAADAERAEHLAHADVFQKMLDRGARVEAETRH